MTRIDCRIAKANGLRPEQYIGGFLERRGQDILLATDEEWNDSIRLDADSAGFLGQHLLRMAGRIRRGMSK